MAKSVIKNIIRIYKQANHLITEAQMEDGSEATGYGDNYRVGETVIVFFFEKYNRVEFKKIDLSAKL